mmetsp:Transcript_30483/g.76645  ORF Transcript_30483/g.76645 Transcript_30483/m.76645 type:complete len:569 (+) Transcript_30483:39-1745(+)
MAGFLARFRGIALVIVAVLAAAPPSSGQDNLIFQGGAAKYYDSFNERLSETDFPGNDYCTGRKLEGFGMDKCVVNRGCCYTPPINEFQPATEKCLPCQDIRGTWQGVLGNCIWKEMQTVVTYDTALQENGPSFTTNRCVPSNVDPTVIVFSEGTGRMAAGVSPSSAPNNGGQFQFEFVFNANGTQGNVDLFIVTFLGTRTLYGKYEVEQSELGSNLFVAFGTGRSPSARPQRTSAVVETEASYVFFEGFRIQDYVAPASTLTANRLPAGSCRHVVASGDDMDSIARRYILNWQEIYAFNAHVYDPENLKPGDVVNVGRHHVVRGPCVNFFRRQVGVESTDLITDYSCTCTSVTNCLTAEGAQQGETLYGVATRYGTSWQRIVDMNPQLQACDATSCAILPGDSLCVVPYLRNVMCEAEYRRYPVVDSNGNSPGYLDTFFSCNPKWANSLTIDKCCQIPRCKCCVSDGYAGFGTSYQDWWDAPTANTCDVTARPHMQCIQNPIQVMSDGAQQYTALCDNDCQLLCDSNDPTVLDPTCPTSVGTVVYSGKCVQKAMLSGQLKKVCSTDAV